MNSFSNAPDPSSNNSNNNSNSHTSFSPTPSNPAGFFMTAQDSVLMPPPVPRTKPNPNSNTPPPPSEDVFGTMDDLNVANLLGEHDSNIFSLDDDNGMGYYPMGVVDPFAPASSNPDDDDDDDVDVDYVMGNAPADYSGMDNPNYYNYQTANSSSNNARTKSSSSSSRGTKSKAPKGPKIQKPTRNKPNNSQAENFTKDGTPNWDERMKKSLKPRAERKPPVGGKWSEAEVSFQS